MKILETPLPGLVVVDTEPAFDSRGRFERVFCEVDWAPIRPDTHFTQVNLSTTAHRGTVRGLHFQHPPAAEAKLIRCVRGEVFDVAVDLRAGSPTFLHWHGLTLRASEPYEVFIPEGFAHGFQALVDDVQMLYLHTMRWTPSLEEGITHDDPRLGIEWPLPVEHISARDRAHPPVAQDFPGIAL